MRNDSAAADVLNLYERGTGWASSRISRVDPELLAVATPCSEWNLRDLLNHVIAGAHLFALMAKGEYTRPPSGELLDFIGDDPGRSYAAARQEALAAFSAPGVLTSTLSAPFGEVAGRELLAIGFCDHVIHGWDIAESTGQDSAIPADLADAAWSLAEGRLEQFRPTGRFAQRLNVADDATSQQKLIGYSGRTPQWKQR